MGTIVNRLTYFSLKFPRIVYTNKIFHIMVSRFLLSITLRIESLCSFDGSPLLSPPSSWFKFENLCLPTFCFQTKYLPLPTYYLGMVYF